MTTAPICDTCTHFRGGIECTAFEQIPPEIFWNELAHTAPLDGDHGIQYDAVVEILDFGPLDPAVLDDWLNDPEFRELFDEELKAEKLAKGGEGWESVTRDEHGRWAEGAGQQAQVDPLRSAAARRAWDTIRANRAREAAAGKQQEPKVTQQDKDLAREFNERLKGGNKIELKPTATDKETPQFRTVKEAEAYAKTLGYKADLGKDITREVEIVAGEKNTVKEILDE